MRAAMVGGGAYMVGKHRAQSQQAQQEQQQAEQQQEQSQDDRISSLEQQGQAPQQAAAPAAPAAGGASIVDKLKELTDMKASGALNDAQFEQAKAQLLGGS